MFENKKILLFLAFIFFIFNTNLNSLENKILIKIENQIKNINLDIRIFKTFYKILNIKKYNLDSKYLIFSGIGDPFSFKDILVENKFNVVREMIFPDHHDYSLHDLEKILNIAKNKNLKIITTEKDHVKLTEEDKKEIKYLEISLELKGEKKLIEFIKKSYEKH